MRPRGGVLPSLQLRRPAARTVAVSSLRPPILQSSANEYLTIILFCFMAHIQPLLPPFPKSSALSKQRLAPVLGPDRPISATSRSTPNHDSDEVINCVPGEPSISLTQAAVDDFLTSELSTPVLDELYDHLWLVACKSGERTDSLHRQRIKGRDIVATESAHLHLVWRYDKIYVKPMPLCLLNYDFWNTYLSMPVDSADPNQDVFPRQHDLCTPAFDRAAVVGFMRSYALLVRHNVDFILARESHLFPAELDWIKWSEFISYFRKFEDRDVANRYHYGQLRLSRLDWAVRLFRPSSAATKWFYEIPHWSSEVYVERAIAPLLFGFASLSLVLSSMQVLLSVPDEALGFHGLGVSSLVPMRRVFWLFSIIILLLSGLVWILLFTIPFSVLLWQLSWGFMNSGKSRARTLRQPGMKIAGKV